ncbi:histidine kinase/DNA gyrase B/HSP90-like ATPase [Actinocorallia herbida]|uniref:histidine kinase n=1 Tax=Actinocorallia herbida TaxID=58109 RepID=A0A3N1D364_9ACTN|nr:nitrate- and nitrite sensing domain-containing protein [Actinocorallia herbida]ROO87926.1 histidine kinase/DNA gyrase B/HSP90-like ATPase [Actinocorallia herbida]
MSSHQRSIRFKIFTLLLIPLSSLVVVWVFAAVTSVGDGLNYFRSKAESTTLITPTSAALFMLETERQVSVQYVAANRAAGGTGLAPQRAKTDATVTALNAAIASDDFQGWARTELKTVAAETGTGLQKLAELRAKVDRGVDWRTVMGDYDALIEQVDGLVEQLPNKVTAEVYQAGIDGTTFARVRSMITHETTLLSGAMAKGRPTAADRRLFAAIVAHQRATAQELLPRLPVESRSAAEQVLATPAAVRLKRMEDQIIAGTRPAVSLAEWQETSAQVQVEHQRVLLQMSTGITTLTDEVTSDIILRLVLTGVLGLATVFGGGFLSIRLGRRLAAELTSLRGSVLTLSDERLPDVVDRLSRNEDVDIESESIAPPPSTTTEVGQVGQAFAKVQRTALEAATGQAELRRRIALIFLNLARRNQSLVRRQLKLLEELQRKVSAPETLDGLYKVDHLTTRMRRHAEGLIILAGGAPGRSWRKPIAIVDLVRAAVSEIEDYKRVKVEQMPPISIDGGAVADVVHLVAELAENATAFSPPPSRVLVRGDVVGHGYVLEVEDRGLGMEPELLAEINERLSKPPTFDLADADRIGLFVVGRLAAQHGIQVSLRKSAYGGTTAVVLLPHSLIAKDSGEPDTPPPPAADERLERTSVPEPVDEPRRDRDARWKAAEPAPVPAPAAPPVPPALQAGQAPAATAGTYGGLPRRNRQASLNPQLRDEPAAVEERETPVVERSPEEVRSRMSSIQRGWARGRTAPVQRGGRTDANRNTEPGREG